MARPPSAPASRKTRIVSFRLNEAEYARLAQKAAAAGLRINDLARTSALSSVQSITIKTFERADPALIKQLHHIGHNLNQLVKNAHIFGRISPKVELLADEIADLIDEAFEERKGP